MKTKELDTRLMELCKKELKSLGPEEWLRISDEWFRAEELKCHIKTYEKLLGM